ncbi:MAG TPA: AraC family transcriptional regulator [Blastocatellia bacterium]
MSGQCNKHLQAGEFYGSVMRRQRLNGIVLSELKHREPRALPAHSHEFGYFSFFLRGDYEEWYGRQTVTHKPLTLMWHPGALQHQDAVGRRGCHFFNAEVSSARLEALREYSAIASSPFVLPGAEAGWLMMRLYHEFNTTEEGYELAMEGLLLELLAALVRRPAQNERQKPQWLRRVEARLRDEFTDKHTMTGLATEAGVHPAHLASVFRRFHRTTVGEFVQQLRIEAAGEMLRQPETPLSELALQLGFADQSHFSRIFRRWTGMTPKAWRALTANFPRDSADEQIQ